MLLNVFMYLLLLFNKALVFCLLVFLFVHGFIQCCLEGKKSAWEGLVRKRKKEKKIRLITSKLLK